MTEFIHEPIEKIIVKNLIHENLENFLFKCYTLKIENTFWVDGMMIIIQSFNFGSGEKEYENMIKGIKYFNKLTFAKQPKYVRSIKCFDGEKYDLPLLNYTNDTKFRKLAKWIKSQPEWNTNPEIDSEEDEKI